MIPINISGRLSLMQVCMWKDIYNVDNLIYFGINVLHLVQVTPLEGFKPSSCTSLLCYVLDIE